jgi:DivIVA domain-containing protein
MEGNASTPHLLTDVRFSVSRKGYDPDEVDNFLERVSGAVAQLQDKLRQSAAQAEAAEARAAEATKARAELEARVATLESELAEAGATGSVAAASSPEEEAARASTVLVMAQRTADSTLAEATANAARTVSAAETQAAALVADAERRSAEMLAASRAEADELVNRRREVLAEEVRGLEAVRDAVAADVAAMEWHVGEQRGVLEASIARVQAVLDDPSSFHLAPAPAGSGASLSDIEDVGAVDRTDGGPVPDPVPTVVVGSLAFAEGETSPAADDAGAAATGADEVPVTAEDERSEALDGPPTLAHPAPGVDESPLGPPDEQADAAMKAFFEAEFDDDPGRGPR